jgi:integrase
MARKPSVRYWPSRKAYCCWFKGKQVVLAEGPKDELEGPVYAAALKKFGELVTLGAADTAKDANAVEVVCELYLRHISSRRKTRTYQIRRQFLQPFVDRFGKTRVRDLARHAVDAWLDEMKQERTHPATGHKTRWSNGSVRSAVASIQACLNWAASSGLITANPLGSMPAPRARSKGREALIGRTPAERRENHHRILAAASKYFRPFIVVLEATGCRPGELVHATADAFDAELGAIVYHAEDNRLDGEHAHKTSGHKDRTIFLTGEALEIVKALVAKYPSGPLFRPRGGKRGWALNEVMRRFRIIRRKTGIPKLTAYSYRHSFATGFLERGGSIDILAELLGNTPDILRKHYSHLLADAGNLRRHLEAFRAATAAGDGQTGSLGQQSGGDGAA